MSENNKNIFIDDLKRSGYSKQAAENAYSRKKLENFSKLGWWDKLKSVFSSGDVGGVAAAPQLPIVEPLHWATKDMIDDPADPITYNKNNDGENSSQDRAFSKQSGGVASIEDNAQKFSEEDNVLGLPNAVAREKAIEDVPEDIQTNRGYSF